jgi:hypothetical protein
MGLNVGVVSFSSSLTHEPHKQGAVYLLPSSTLGKRAENGMGEKEGEGIDHGARPGE